MQPQKIALLILMILSLVELLSCAGRRQRVRPAGLRILIKARERPQLAEGLVRYLMWELAVWRGLDIEVILEIDSSCAPREEMKAVQAILLEEGLLSPARDLVPDLVFIV